MEQTNILTEPGNSKWLKNFIPVWLGQVASLLGSALVQFALIWWMTRQTGSATTLATAALVGSLPGIFLGPFVGTLVDRFNRKAVMIISDALVAGAVLVLVLLFSQQAIDFWHIYLLMVVRSIGGAFHWAAMNASVSQMVPEAHLARVGGVNQSIMGFIGIAAPPLGALLFESAAFSIEQILLIDVITAAVAIGLLLIVRIPEHKQEEAAFNLRNLLAETRAAFHWLGDNRFIRNLILTILAFYLCFTPFNALEPLFVTDHLDAGPVLYGFLDAAFGLGAILGGVLMGIWGGFKKNVHTVMLGIALQGVGLLVHSVSTPGLWWLAALGFVLAGAMFPLINGPFYALLQTRVDAVLQGRIFALLNSASSAIGVLALLLIGPLADAFSVRLIYIIVSMGMLLVAGVGVFWLREE